MRALALVGALALFGCDDPNVHAALQTALYSYMPDGSDPAVQDFAESLLEHGETSAWIECTGIALGAPGKFVSVYYHASKLQTGACFATANITGQSSSGPGFAQSNASRLTSRGTLADTCPVTSFHVPGLRSDTTVSGGAIRVESPFCAPGACQMLVSTNCTGLNIDRF